MRPLPWPCWLAVTVVLCAPAARAQHTSAFDMSLPISSVAACDGPLCLAYNPAGMAFGGSTEGMYLHEESWSVSGRPAGRADGLLLTTPLLGLGFQYLRPDAGRPTDDVLKVDLAVRLLRFGEVASLAAGLQILDPTETSADAALDWNLGLMLRPWRYLSLGVVGRDLAGATLGDRSSQRSLDLGLAGRPLWFAPERLTLAVDYRLIEDQPDPAVRFSALATIVDGLGLAATVDLDGHFGVGLALDLLHFGLGGATTFRHDDGLTNTGFVVTARASLEQRPGFRLLDERTAEVHLVSELEPTDAPRARLLGHGRSLGQVRAAIWRAAEDDSVDSLLVKVEDFELSTTAVQELREALAAFRAAGKKVVFYLESATNRNYHLACAGDAIYLSPAGSLTVTGPTVEATFLKGTLDLLGVRAEAIRVGQYKSAIETVTREEPSDSSREMLNSLVDEFADQIFGAIAEGRKLSRAEVVERVDRGLMAPQEAVDSGLVDGLAYWDEMDEVLEKALGHRPRRDEDYLEERTHLDRWGGLPVVAVVHADGSIQYGKSLLGGMDARVVADLLDELRGQSRVAAVVLRIDSPGGSGLASDLIWRQVKRLKEAKPVIVSMGTVAASGGYYIAAPADRILADPATLTGSIGVFALLFDASELWAKIGISRESFSRGALADLFTTFRNRTPEELKRLQDMVDAFYQGFVSRVAEGRGKPVEAIEPVAQGRVWTGRQALEHGLVDELGGLERAIQVARERAGIPIDEAIRVIHLPRSSASLRSLLSDLGILSTRAEEAIVPAAVMALGRQIMLYSALGAEPVLAMLPFLDLEVR